MSLAGIRVLDLTRVLAGPYCTMMLADMGAEVVKVENPVLGDETRQWRPPIFENESTYFLGVNRNKQSIALDLKNAKDKRLLHQLAAKCDVLVENFKPSTTKKLGIDFDTLRQQNPKIIYASITGFGSRGPWADRLAYDVFVSAASGLMSITGSKDKVAKCGVAMTDIVTGLQASTAICAALVERQRSGQGQKLETSLFHAQLSALANVASAQLLAGVETKRLGTAHASIVPYQAFSTRDGEMCVGALNNQQHSSLLNALKASATTDKAKSVCEQLSGDTFASNEQRVENRQIYIPLLQEILNTKTVDEWMEILDGIVPCSPILSVEEALNSKHSRVNKLVETVDNVAMVTPPVQFSRTPSRYLTRAPKLNENFEQILKKWEIQKSR